MRAFSSLRAPCQGWTLRLLVFAGFALLLGCGGVPGQPPLSVRVSGDGPFPIRGATCRLQARVDLGGEELPPGQFTCQWFRDGQALPGATAPLLALDGVGSPDAGQYTVRVFRGDLAATAGPFPLLPVDQVRWVTNTEDAGPGSLRQALEEMNPPREPQRAVRLGLADEGYIRGLGFGLPQGAQAVIRLASPLPPLTSRIRILGSPGLVVSGEGRVRPFFVEEGAEVTLEGFEIIQGLALGGCARGGGGAAPGMGGALFINGGSVTLRSMVFRANTAQGGDSLPGGDGEDGGGAGFDTDSPLRGGAGANGGLLGGEGGGGAMDGTLTYGLSGGGPGIGDGAGGGAVRGALWTAPLQDWRDNLPGGAAGTFAGGGGFSVGPIGGGGDGSFGGGGGGSGGDSPFGPFPGVAGGGGGYFGGDGGRGDLVSRGRGGGGAGLGGAVFLRRGTLDLRDCAFLGNRVLGGDGAERGLGKGGAVFIMPMSLGALGPEGTLALLRAQVWSDNRTQDLLEEPAFDNNDWYLATADLEIPAPGSELRARIKRYRAMLAGKAP